MGSPDPQEAPCSTWGKASGKTTLIGQFAKQYDQYIYLNLEIPADRQPFERFTTMDNLVQAIFFTKNKSLLKKEKTLLFIDEIQEHLPALNLLRYFYEQQPDLAVIAAGSMLETIFDKNLKFPVGRVEYLVLRPASFPEFLSAMGETAALEQLLHIPIAPFAHEKLTELFHIYSLIGGMPEVVNHYATHRDLKSLGRIYESLLASYIDDVEKYAEGDSQIAHIRHAIRSSFALAGKRIRFEGFGNSPYRSREMGDALRTLEKALILQLVYPQTDTQLPLLPDVKKSPRLHLLDTGLVNYFLGIQKSVLSATDLNSVYQGIVIEHLVGQELLATKYEALSKLYFWAREKKESTAEVDYLLPFEGKLIPIEVKAGADGTLRSLHQFMDMAAHDLAIRYYAGMFNISYPSTQLHKKYRLLNIPYYLVSQVEGYVGSG